MRKWFQALDTSGAAYERALASVEKRPRNGQTSTSWLARWRDPDGRSRIRSFRRRVDADRFITMLAAGILRGDYVHPNDPTTAKEYAEAWRLAQVHRPTTRAHVETNLRRHVYPHFGNRRLATVRPSEVQAWVTRLSGT